MKDRILLFERQIGAAADRTWEDMTVPADCRSVADLLTTLRENAAEGIYRLCYVDENSEAQVFRFYVRRIESYEIVTCTDES